MFPYYPLGDIKVPAEESEKTNKTNQ
jgi:hypothetical protein